MDYQFYGYDRDCRKVVFAKRSMRDVSISTVARKLRDFALKKLGNDCFIVDDGSIVGGYYRDKAGETVAVEVL